MFTKTIRLSLSLVLFASNIRQIVRAQQLTPVVLAMPTQDGNGTRTTYYCLGSLLSPDWVLTGAHCVLNDDGIFFAEIQLLVGGRNRFSISPSAANVFTRLNYVGAGNAAAGEHGLDYALIKLPNSLPLQTVSLYCGTLHFPTAIFVNFENGRRLVPGRVNTLDCREALARVTAESYFIFEPLICTPLVIFDGSSGGPLLAEHNSQQMVQFAVASQKINDGTTAVNLFNRVDCDWINEVARDRSIVYVP